MSMCHYLICSNISEPFGYNFAYSVHHPAFVALYAKYVLPRFTSIPQEVVAYLNANKEILNQHKTWIGTHINSHLV